MKKIYILLVVLLSFALGLKAQTFQFANEGNVIDDTLKLNISTGDERTDYIHFTNLSTESKTIKVYLEVLQLGNGGSLFMCFNGNCLLDTISPSAITLEPNVEYSEFDLLYMYSSDRPTIAKVHLIDSATMQSLQSFVVAYKNLDNSLEKPAKQNITSTSLEAYPNPAKNSATINYSIASSYRSGSIIVRNMIGSVVKTISINGGSTGKQSISTYDLPNGVYFYSIVGDGKTLSTKKLIVKH